MESSSSFTQSGTNFVNTYKVPRDLVNIVIKTDEVPILMEIEGGNRQEGSSVRQAVPCLLSKVSLGNSQDCPEMALSPYSDFILLPPLYILKVLI